MVKNVKGKPLITQSYFDANFRGLASMFRRGFFGIVVLLIVVLVMLGLVYDASGTELTCEGEVSISSIECFTDHRFFDDWKTTTTASIRIDETKQFLNQHDVELWSNGYRLSSYVGGVQTIDVSGLDVFSIKLVDRRTLERRTLQKSECVSMAICSFAPPPHDAVWAWDEDVGEFVLTVLGRRWCDDDKSFDDCIDLKYTISEVSLTEWESR